MWNKNNSTCKIVINAHVFIYSQLLLRLGIFISLLLSTIPQRKQNKRNELHKTSMDYLITLLTFLTIFCSGRKGDQKSK